MLLIISRLKTNKIKKAIHTAFIYNTHVHIVALINSNRYTWNTPGIPARN